MAKTHLELMAKRFVYGYSHRISSKYLEKGLMVEQEGIDLYNEVFFKSVRKNTERRSNTFLTGMPDLIDDDCIPDIKCCWSLETFPQTKSIAKSKAKDEGYDWQGRAYMWLFEKPFFEVAFCMVNTPDQLLRDWDSKEVHIVDHINPALRVTCVQYERDLTIETEIAIKVNHAKHYFQEIVEQIKSDHSI